MSIIYPITLPNNNSFTKVQMTCKNVIGVSASPFTGQVQTHRFDGDRWQISIAVKSMYKKDAEEWISSLVSLNGIYGTFLIGDVSSPNIKGKAIGIPEVDGIPQSPDTINIKSLTPDIEDIFIAGDYIQIEKQLYKILTNANSDANGKSEVNVWPRTRKQHPDSTPIIISNTVGVFRLDKNSISWDINPNVLYSGIFISAIEDISS